jgi:hypothetical protein
MTIAPTKPGYAGGSIFLESNGNATNSNTTVLESGTYSTYIAEKRGAHRPDHFDMLTERSEADACDNSKASTTANYCNTTVCTTKDFVMGCSDISIALQRQLWSYWQHPGFCPDRLQDWTPPTH